MKVNKEIPVNHFLGMSFVFTGAMATMDRKTAQGQVKDAGGTCPSSVTSSLDYLVIGDEGSALFGYGSRGSKHVRADKLISDGAGLRVISETEFLKMLER